MNKLKLSAVSYINTWPFLQGLERADFSQELEVELDVPSKCAQKFADGDVDIALIPVGALPDCTDYRVLDGVCIGCNGHVDTVCLFSNLPIEEVRTIHLDAHSRTSNELVKYLTSHRDDIEFYTQESTLKPCDAELKIGDKAFLAKGTTPFEYDLGQLWKEKTGMPFAFAVWVVRSNVDRRIEEKLKFALKDGLRSIPEIIKQKQAFVAHVNLDEYLNKRIDYVYDDAKKSAVELFLNFVNSNKPSVVHEIK